MRRIVAHRTPDSTQGDSTAQGDKPFRAPVPAQMAVDTLPRLGWGGLRRRLGFGASRRTVDPAVVFVANREFGSIRQLSGRSTPLTPTGPDDWVQVDAEPDEDFDAAEAVDDPYPDLTDPGYEDYSRGLPGEPSASEPLSDEAGSEAGWTPPASLTDPEEPGDCVPEPYSSVARRSGSWEGLPRKILLDYAEFYSPRSLAWMGAGFGVGAIMANTNFDQELYEAYHADDKGDLADDKSSIAKTGGEGMTVVPAIVVVTLLSHGLKSHIPLLEPVDEWGTRSVRAYMVGGPAMLLMQKVTGGSRPEESEHGSRWEFWQDNNGVSGHAFVSSVPFITAAKMVKNPWAKGALYAGSFVTSWSRFHDQDHYASQVLLGWWLAYLATEAVERSNERYDNLYIGPTVFENGAVGVMVDYRY